MAFRLLSFLLYCQRIIEIDSVIIWNLDKAFGAYVCKRIESFNGLAYTGNYIVVCCVLKIMIKFSYLFLNRSV